jgi:endonuclease/exonuclease/phosphatase family metal-dependent hydrolase
MAVLSRLPIIESVNHRLPDGDEPRSALTLKVRLPSGGELVFAGIHFYRTEEERLAQATTLLRLLDGESAPVMLAGDFNSEPGTAVMQALAARFHIADKGDDRFTFSSFEPVREIDFILVSPADRFEFIEHRPIDEPVASDHRPLIATVVVRR